MTVKTIQNAVDIFRDADAKPIAPSCPKNLEKKVNPKQRVIRWFVAN
jgi:hypothetical protein